MYSTRYVHPQTQSAGTVGVCTYNDVDEIGAASHPPLTSIDFTHYYPKPTKGIGFAVLHGYLLCELYLLTRRCSARVSLGTINALANSKYLSNNSRLDI